METLFKDLRFAVKLLWKDKGFTFTALVTLALAIGVNSAIFTVTHSVLLRPLPFPEPGRLVAIYNSYPGVGILKGANATPDYLDRRKETEVFEEVALFGTDGYDLGEGSPQRVAGVYTTPSLFRLLGVRPALGRIFMEEEAVPGKDKVALLSYGLWNELYARSPSALGKDIRLTGVPYRIVGVLPEGFEFLARDARLWVPFAFTPRQSSDDARHNNNWAMVARLRPGATIAQAQHRIDAINRVNLERFPQYRKLLEDARFQTRVQDLRENLVEEVRPTLYLLQGAVVFVLLIGCVNVANLMLVRATLRMKELAIRFSLGAGRWRLGRQLLTESTVLAVSGGLLGILLGFWGVRLLTYLGSERLPLGSTIRMDGAVLAFTLLLAVLSGLLFGIAPVAHLLRRDLIDVFRQTERAGTGDRKALGIRGVLVAAEVSLAFVLLIGAGLMTLSFVRVLSTDPGFRPEHVLTAQISLPGSRYAEEPALRGFENRLLDSVQTLPGVKSAALTNRLPFASAANASAIQIEGYTRGPGEGPPVPGFSRVSRDYFRSMGIPLMGGRAFEETDTAEAQKVCIIDQFLARKYWPGRNPVGKKIIRGVEASDPAFTVIGVAGTVKRGDLAEQDPRGQVYFHYKQWPPQEAYIVVKTDREQAVARAIRRQVLNLDPELPVYDVETMPERLARTLVNRRAPMVLCLVFSGLALLLAAVGIYGVLAYAVAQRTREFGVRLALGARTGDILRMVFYHGARLAGAGLLVGVGGAYWLTRVVRSLLYEVKPTDPGVFVLVSLVLAGVALVAALIPSLRATRIDPVVAIRYE